MSTSKRHASSILRSSRSSQPVIHASERRGESPAIVRVARRILADNGAYGVIFTNDADENDTLYRGITAADPEARKAEAVHEAISDRLHKMSHDLGTDEQEAAYGLMTSHVEVAYLIGVAVGRRLAGGVR